MSWLSFGMYEATYGFSTIAGILGFSLRIRGTRNVPRSGPVLLIANHQSFFDPVLIGLAARRHLSYLARASLFRNAAFAWLIRMHNAVPIHHHGLGIEGLRTVLGLLEGGQAVVVFPEGERTRDGALHELQPGIQLLIRRAQAPVVPVGIAGAYDSWPHGRKLPLPAPLFLPAWDATIAVAVGRPLDARQLGELPRQQLLNELFEAMKAMHEEANCLRRKPR